MIRGHSNTLITDLPGIYSMPPYSSEEMVTRTFVLEEHPKGLINNVDASNIERNLYLTLQLMELDIPMVLALNMMDEVRGLVNWWVMHCILQNIRRVQAGWISAMENSMRELCTDAFMGSCI